MQAHTLQMVNWVAEAELMAQQIAKKAITSSMNQPLAYAQPRRQNCQML
jgi:hypothetical protein